MTTTLLIKLDKRLKIQAQKTAAAMDLPLSTVIKEQLRDFVEKKEINFCIPHIPNAKTARKLDRILKDVRAGKNVSGPFKTGAEMDRYLDSL